MSRTSMESLFGQDAHIKHQRHEGRRCPVGRLRNDKETQRVRSHCRSSMWTQTLINWSQLFCNLHYRIVIVMQALNPTRHASIKERVSYATSHEWFTLVRIPPAQTSCGSPPDINIHVRQGINPLLREQRGPSFNATQDNILVILVARI